ncbi:MAG TPA: hypothetical protein VIL95_08575, partial [Bacillota bacterium]
MRAVAAAVAILALASALATPALLEEGPFDPRPVLAGDTVTYRLTLRNPSLLPIWVTGITARVEGPLWLAHTAGDRLPLVGEGPAEIDVPIRTFVGPRAQRSLELTLEPIAAGDLTLQTVTVRYWQGLSPRRAELAAVPWQASVAEPAPDGDSFAVSGAFTGGADPAQAETVQLQLVQLLAEDRDGLTRLEFRFEPAGGQEAAARQNAAQALPPYAVQRLEGDWLRVRWQGVGLATLRAQLQALADVPTVLEYRVDEPAANTVDLDLNIDRLAEFRAATANDPPRLIVEWRSGVPGRDWVYDVRVGATDRDRLTAFLAALGNWAAPVLSQPEGDGWLIGRYDDRVTAERLVRALAAAGFTATIEVTRLAP